jgi:nucleoid-associated protein YgaU
MASYVVKQGDTLPDLARRFLGDARRYREFVGYQGDPMKVPPGTTIHIPHGPDKLPPIVKLGSGRR